MNKKVLDRINSIADIYETSNREQKAVEELIELLNALMHRDKLNTLEEFADVIITMIQVLKKYDLKIDSFDDDDVAIAVKKCIKANIKNILKDILKEV